jgi:hypothetical protein
MHSVQLSGGYFSSSLLLTPVLIPPISILTPIVIPIILTLEFAALALPTFSAGGGTYGCLVLPSEASSARANSYRVSRLAQTLCGSRI